MLMFWSPGELSLVVERGFELLHNNLLLNLQLSDVIRLPLSLL